MQKLDNFTLEEHVLSEEHQEIRPTIKWGLFAFKSLSSPFFILLFFQNLEPMFRALGFSLWTILITISIVAYVIGILIQYIPLKYKVYSFYQDRLEYTDSFWVKNRKSVPYSRITNISQKRGIIERIFGLGTIEVETAGTGKEISISYLSDTDKVFNWINHIIRETQQPVQQVVQNQPVQNPVQNIPQQ